jgi:hypothetical protein
MKRRDFIRGAAGLFVPMAPAIILPEKAWAQVGGLMFPGPGTPASSGGGSTATFDPAQKFQITLSGGNLTATNSVGAGQFGVARGTTSHSTGKFYLEWTTTISGTNQVGIGLSDTTQSFASGFYNGGVAHSMGTTVTSAVSLLKSPIGASSVSFAAGGGTTGDVVGFAIDIGAGLTWARRNAGNWNNDIIANQNPATGTGGIPISLTGALYFACDVQSNAASGTVNTGGSAYANAAPSGFGSWT